MELSRVKIDLNKAQAQAEQFAPIFRQFQQLAANGADKADGKNPFPLRGGHRHSAYQEDAATCP